MKVFSVEFFEYGYRELFVCANKNIAYKKTMLLIIEFLERNGFGNIPQTNLQIKSLINQFKFTEAILLFNNIDCVTASTAIHEHNLLEDIVIPEQDVVILSLVK